MRARRITAFRQIPFLVHMEPVQARVQPRDCTRDPDPLGMLFQR